MNKLPELVIANLRLKHPIIQGGMGVAVSKASLAAAVSREGGLGVIASVGLGEDGDLNIPYEKRSADALRTEIRKVKEQGLPVGVNIMVALTNYASLARTCVEEQADVIISGAGLPLRLPEYAMKSNTKLVPIVSSGRACEILCKTWLKKYQRFPDAIIVEGPRAGGHLGFNFDLMTENKTETLEDIIKAVIQVVKKFGQKTPIIAAGGVYDGADIARLIKLGAAGVQMATRFVATDECDASIEYKKAYVAAKKEDVVIIRSPVGMPARVIMNDFVKRSLGEKMFFSCPYKCLITCNAREANYCIAEALLNASRGHFDKGFAMCGENVWRIDKIVSVKELIQELVKDASEHLT